MYDKDGTRKLYKTPARVVLPDGTVLINAQPDPERGLYNYQEVGPKRPGPGKKLEVAEENDGYNYTVTRAEVADPDFDLAEYKQTKCKSLKVQANGLLQATDWQVLASIDPARGGVPRAMPQEVRTYRKAIIEAAENAEAAIIAADRLADIEAVAPVWPEAQ